MDIESYEKLLSHVGQPTYNEIKAIFLGGIPKTVIKLPDPLPDQLEELYIWDSKVESLPEPLPPTLRILLCTTSCLQSLPAVLPSSLKWLSVSENQLKIMPVIPSSVETLDVSGNQLESLIIPDGVTHAYFDNNKLSELPTIPASVERLRPQGNLFALPSLTDFELRDNVYHRVNVDDSLTNVEPKTPEISETKTCVVAKFRVSRETATGEITDFEGIIRKVTLDEAE